MQPASTVSRVRCPFPRCGKLFNRKEHLTRHLKSHDPQLQHECPICRRRYARSDVLKRHVDNHSPDSNARRTLVACTACHERKLKCDDSVPCRSCTRTSTQCSRVGQDRERSVTMRQDIDSESANGYPQGDNEMSGSDAMLIHQIDAMNEISPARPNSDLQQSWFQDDWSLPLLPVTNTPFLGNLNAGLFTQWAVNPSEQGHIEGALSSATFEDDSFLFQTNSSPQVKKSTNASWFDVDQLGGGTASSLVTQSPASSRSPQEILVSDLHGCLSKDTPASARLIQTYFAELHQYWPILHAPTFDPTKAPDVLLGSIVMLASWLEGEPDHIKLAPLVFDAVTANLLEHNISFGRDVQPSSLHALQALLLCVVYTMYCLTVEGMLARALHFNGILVSTCRHLGIFNGQSAHHDLGDSPFALWLAQEQLHRLALAVLRVDAYLSVLADHPPSVRYQEISIPLPKSTSLWTATSEEERRRLQWNEPAGREKALFCFFMRDALDFNRERLPIFHLTESDYHLGLCSLQVGTWEAAREAFCCCDPDELVTTSTAQNSIQLWRTQLNLWRTRMENDCQHHNNQFPVSPQSDDHIFSLLNLILWHISALTIHAPLKLLQSQGCCFKCRPGTGTISTQKTKARLSAWLASPHPRDAVWNAAQICRIVADKSTDTTPSTHLLLNPLAIPGILKSAIATCSYAYYTRGCAECTGRPRDTFDLFSAKEDDEKFVRWKEKGEGMATWGPDRILICQCKFKVLANWFRRALARDKGAERESWVHLGTVIDTRNEFGEVDLLLWSIEKDREG